MLRYLNQKCIHRHISQLFRKNFIKNYDPVFETTQEQVVFESITHNYHFSHFIRASQDDNATKLAFQKVCASSVVRGAHIIERYNDAPSAGSLVPWLKNQVGLCDYIGPFIDAFPPVKEEKPFALIFQNYDHALDRCDGAEMLIRILSSSAKRTKRMHVFFLVDSEEHYENVNTNKIRKFKLE